MRRAAFFIPAPQIVFTAFELLILWRIDYF